MDKLPIPPVEAIFYEDDKVYACLASYPLTHGHSIVVWKNGVVPDLARLNCRDYDYLMNVVDAARDVLIKFLGVEKVYLLYMDEIKQVHWHLVPRYNEKGINVLLHEPGLLKDFALAKSLRSSFVLGLKQHPEITTVMQS